MEPNCETEPCWICLSDEVDEATGQLLKPCRCPRWVHKNCMARWQLRCCGKNEERFCKFCSQELPDWRKSLFSEPLETASTEGVCGEMEVVFGDRRFRCSAKSGPEGQREFMERVRRECNLDDGVEFSLNFCVKEPISGQMLRLDGSSAFDAAVLCSAAEFKRMDKQQTQSAPPSTSSSLSSSAPPRAAPSRDAHRLAPASADAEPTDAASSAIQRQPLLQQPKPEEEQQGAAAAAGGEHRAIAASRARAQGAQQLQPSAVRGMIASMRRIFAAHS